VLQDANPSICFSNFNKLILVERQVIDKSGGKKIKNPPEDIERCAAFLINSCALRIDREVISNLSGGIYTM
jgi:hypothetical protein